jgi:hypothetical protein
MISNSLEQLTELRKILVVSSLLYRINSPGSVKWKGCAEQVLRGVCVRGRG